MTTLDHFRKKLSTYYPDFPLEFILDIFKYQANHVPIYSKFVNTLGINPNTISKITEIPFLPVRLFQTETVLSDEVTETETVFESSGTASENRSRHSIDKVTLYLNYALQHFINFTGFELKTTPIFALLPNYIENPNSSLIAMIQCFMTQNEKSEIFGWNFDVLAKRIEQTKQQKILWGTSFALLDFIEQFPNINTTGLWIVETGGMKNKRREIPKNELLAQLSKLFRTEIYSEYGMTELLSQAYAKNSTIYKCNPTLRVKSSPKNAPLLVENTGIGQLKFIDILNLHSCSFIATEDYGKVHSERNFEILGRMKNTQLRGCHLMLGDDF